MANAPLQKIDVNIMEYCYVYEDTILPVNSVKITLPKVFAICNNKQSNFTPNIYLTAPECKPSVTHTVGCGDYIVAKPYIDLNINYSHFADSYVDGAGRIIYYLKKGRRMICTFMDCNINDAYITANIYE